MKWFTERRLVWMGIEDGGGFEIPDESPTRTALDALRKDVGEPLQDVEREQALTRFRQQRVAIRSTPNSDEDTLGAVQAEDVAEVNAERENEDSKDPSKKTEEEIAYDKESRGEQVTAVDIETRRDMTPEKRAAATAQAEAFTGKTFAEPSDADLANFLNSVEQDNNLPKNPEALENYLTGTDPDGIFATLRRNYPGDAEKLA